MTDTPEAREAVLRGSSALLRATDPPRRGGKHSSAGVAGSLPKYIGDPGRDLGPDAALAKIPHPIVPTPVRQNSHGGIGMVVAPLGQPVGPLAVPPFMICRHGSQMQSVWLQPCVYGCARLLSPDMQGCARRDLKVAHACARLSSTSTGPTSGRKCYITPAFSGIPNKGDRIKAQKKITKRKMVPWPCKSRLDFCKLPALGLEPMPLQL